MVVVANTLSFDVRGGHQARRPSFLCLLVWSYGDISGDDTNPRDWLPIVRVAFHDLSCPPRGLRGDAASIRADHTVTVVAAHRLCGGETCEVQVRSCWLDSDYLLPSILLV